MGDHYLPQYYLKGFSQNNGKTIWAYDIQQRTKFPTQVKSVANQTGFYGSAMEQRLANEIEWPGNRVLDKIRNLQSITAEDTGILAKYIAVMKYRVPESKRSYKEQAPYSAEMVYRRFESYLSAVEAAKPEEADLVERQRGEARKILDDLAENPPDDVWRNGIIPGEDREIVRNIRSMRWTFLTSCDGPTFLTCDNPVFHFSHLGIGSPDSELTFPISSQVTLLLSRNPDIVDGYRPVASQVVKKMNRRTAYNAGRYVFHQRDEKWILPFATKRKFRLNKLF